MGSGRVISLSHAPQHVVSTVQRHQAANWQHRKFQAKKQVTRIQNLQSTEQIYYALWPNMLHYQWFAFSKLWSGCS